MDIARSLQERVNEVGVEFARVLRARHGDVNLCLAGGVALNCVANGRLQREGSLHNLWLQPAAGDAGGYARDVAIQWRGGHRAHVWRAFAWKAIYIVKLYS